MEFLLLGPVEVRAAGRLVDSGGPRQRSVLAALALDVGRPVLTDTVVDRVWGSDPPGRARHALHVYVGRIREVLRNASAAEGVPARLVRGSGGYRLEVDPDCVDMHQFRRMINDARAPTAADSARGVLLRRALDLWRGAPLADLSGEWAAQVREGWRQHRIDAVLRWAQVELELGNPGAVAGPLTDVLGDYPLDESLAAILMRALAAAGRSADALSCYATMRRRLVDELGVEPGAELQRMHLTILRSDGPARRTDDLAVITAARSDARGPTPAELPADIADFTGRTEEIRQLVDTLGSTGRRTSGRAVAIAVLAGRAGVGKTALAVHLGHRLRAEFPDGQLYADLRGADRDPVEPAAALTRFCRALGVNDAALPRTVDDLAACYRSHTADRRMLVVLDNAASEARYAPCCRAPTAAPSSSRAGTASPRCPALTWNNWMGSNPSRPSACWPVSRAPVASPSSRPRRGRSPSSAATSRSPCGSPARGSPPDRTGTWPPPPPGSPTNAAASTSSCTRISTCAPAWP